MNGQFANSIGRLPGGSGIPVNWDTFTPPIYAVFPLLLEILTVAAAFGVGVKTQVGVTAGLTR